MMKLYVASSQGGGGRRIVARKPNTRRFLKEGRMCFWCDQPVDPKHATLEHVIPLSCNGSNCLDNLDLSHAFCNHHAAEIQKHYFNSIQGAAFRSLTYGEIRETLQRIFRVKYSTCPTCGGVVRRTHGKIRKIGTGKGDSNED